MTDKHPLAMDALLAGKRDRRPLWHIASTSRPTLGAFTFTCGGGSAPATHLGEHPTPDVKSDGWALPRGACCPLSRSTQQTLELRSLAGPRTPLLTSYSGRDWRHRRGRELRSREGLLV